MKPNVCVLVSVLFGGLTAAGCARSPAPRLESAEKSAATAGSANPAVVDARLRGWELGQRRGYDVKLSTAVAFDEGGNAFDFELSALLTLEVRATSAESATLYATLSNANIVSRIPSGQAELSSLAAELRTAGAFFVLEGGRIGDLSVPTEMSAMAASTYRQLAAGLQFVHAKSGADRYTANESDTTGEYVAEYVRAPGGAWNKHKLRYVGLLEHRTLPGDMGQRLIPEVVESRGEIRFGSDERPTSIKLADRMLVKGAQAPIRSSIGVELVRAEPAPVAKSPAEIDALLPRMKRFAANQSLSDEQTHALLDDAKIGGLDFDTILAELAGLAAQKAKQAAGKPSDQPLSPEDQAQKERELQKEAKLFNALAATFRKDPRTAQKAVEKFRSDSPVANKLVEALGSAGTPEAHRALGKLLVEPDISRETRGRIVLSLARTPNPTPEATQALQALLEREPGHAGALYGLGTYSRVHRDRGETAEATRLGEFLVSRLELARGPMSRAIALRAVANSGYAGALPRVLPYLEDKNEQTRAVAVRALQSVLDSRVDGLIVTRLTTDASEKVRLAALDAVKLREPNETLAAALKDQGTHDEDPHVRYRAVELMADWLARRPELRPVLEQVAKNDAESRIRERAQAAL